MIYLDSTYIVKCYINERGSSEVLQLVHLIRDEARACIRALRSGQEFIGKFARVI